MGFWQIYLFFTVLSMLFVLWPFFRGWREHKKALRQDVRSEVSEAVQADRKKELEEIRVLGEISEQEYSSLHKDLEKTIAYESAVSPEPQQNAITFGSKSRTTLIVVCILVPLLSLALYSVLGAKPDWDIRQAVQDMNQAAEYSPDKHLALIAKIQKRLTQTPENSHLLFLLASTSSQAGDYDQAVKAYRELKGLYPESALVIAELAQSLFLRAGNTMTPEVRENTQLSLSLDANLPTALGLAGIHAFQSGDYAEAIALWQKAIKPLDPNSAASIVLSQGIARAQAALKVSSVDSSEAGSDKNDATELVVEVDIADDVKGLSGGEVLFVYARAWQGPKIPLAIQRLNASAFPITVKLNKSMAMAEGMDITTAPQLEIVARISASGNATPKTGDWSASLGPVILGENSNQINLMISEQIP